MQVRKQQLELDMEQQTGSLNTLSPLLRRPAQEKDTFQNIPAHR